MQDCELGLDNRKLNGQLTQIIREMQESQASKKWQAETAQYWIEYTA